jgi:exosortase K
MLSALCPPLSALCPSPSALCRFKRNILFYLAAILMALALKQHYSLAGAEALKWILGPTAGLVSMLSGEAFSFVPGAGYVCDACRVIIAPGCAGVNFMLMAFGMAAFTGLYHMRRGFHRFSWLAGSLAAAYALTLGVNAFRILLSMYTFRADVFGAGPAWEWVHRLEGVVIYFFFQYLFYSMIRKTIKRYLSADPVRKSGSGMTFSGRCAGVRKAVLTGLTPCAWYLAVTLAVPFLNHAPQKTGGRFYDHAAMVLGLCMLTWICIVAVQLCGQGIRLLFTGGPRKHEAQNPDC